MIRIAAGKNVVIKLILASLIVVGTISTPCAAAEFGIGVAVNGDSQTLYFPINITKNFRTEISVGYATADETIGEADMEMSRIAAGVGVFFLKEVYEKTKLYYGCRFLYLDQEQEMSDFEFTHKLDAKGYSISPTLGFEYAVTNHFSLGAEIEYYYQRLDGDDSRPYFDGQTRDIEQTSTGLDSRVVVRFYF